MSDLISIVGIMVAGMTSAGALYGAIRRDLATAIATAEAALKNAERAESAAIRAHNRIDAVMRKGDM